MKIAKYVAIFSAFVFAAFGGLVLLSPSALEYTVNKDIHAPIETCWTTVTNYDLAPKWIAGLTSVKQLHKDKEDAYPRYEMRFGEEENSMVMRQKITILNHNEMYAYTGIVDDFLEKISSTTFKPIDSTTTRLSTKVKMKALSFRMKLFMNNDASFKRAEAENLDRLQELIEQN